jgi:hypothetical protein
MNSDQKERNGKDYRFFFQKRPHGPDYFRIVRSGRIVIQLYTAS